MRNSFKSIVEVQQHSCKKFSKNNLYGTIRGNEIEWMSYEEFGMSIDNLRGGLASLGVSRGDKVAIISKNCIEWPVCAYATYSLGAHFVPMYEAQTLEDWEYIIKDSFAKVLFVADSVIHEKLKAYTDIIDSLENIIVINGNANHSNSLANLLEKGKKNPVDSIFPDWDEPLGLTYTSGTTGKPKGVVITHGNMLSEIDSINKVINMNSTDRTLSFLPWAHLFGQFCEIHFLIFKGSSSVIVQDIAEIINDLSVAKPSILVSVPRIFNKIYESIHLKIQKGSSLIGFLFNRGIETAQKKQEGESCSRLDTIFYILADKLIFRKIRNLFGGSLRFAISGGAAMSKEVAQFMEALKIRIYEGYGLTETTVSIAVNSEDARRIGSVGKPVPGVKILLDNQVIGQESDEGEIVVYGPHIMKGYHNLPDATREVMTDDGGFRTGDIGRYDDDGFLYITGRIKELYKLENGKYVAPAPLEEKLSYSSYINHVIIYGENKSYNIAIIAPELSVLKDFAAINNIDTTEKEWLKNDIIQKLFEREVNKYSASFKNYERPQKFYLTDEEWTPDNGFLTPTLKLKRNKIVEKFAPYLELLYENN